MITLYRRSIKISLTSVGLDFLVNFNQEITNIMKSKIECLDKDDLISLHHALDDLYIGSFIKSQNRKASRGIYFGEYQKCMCF